MRRTLGADRTGQTPRVHTANRNLVILLEPSIKFLGAAPVRGLRWDPFRDHAGGDGVLCFVVFARCACVPDMGEGECHDLPCIRWVGHDLLVAGHRSVKAQLGRHIPQGAKADPLKNGSIGQYD